jgi:hypothetical protein
MSHEFKVLLDGIDLEEDQVSQINRAVQQAVMHSLATLDVPGSLGIQFADGPRSPRLPQRIYGIIICRKEVPCLPELLDEG